MIVNEVTTKPLPGFVTAISIVHAILSTVANEWNAIKKRITVRHRFFLNLCFLSNV